VLRWIRNEFSDGEINFTKEAENGNIRIRIIQAGHQNKWRPIKKKISSHE
jgi:hypothetical protein